MGAAVEIRCAACGKTFTAYKYDIEIRGRKYCSAVCQGIARRTPVPAELHLRRFYEAGFSTNELADHYSVSKGTIYNWFKKYAIQSRSPAAGRRLAQTHSPNQGNSASERRCTHCGAAFTPALKTSKRTICSPDCMSAAGVERTRFIRRGRAARSGRRDSLDGLYVRSSWEASYGAVLNEWKRLGRIVDWKYEPRTFVFDRITRGNRSYTPDFQVFYPDGSYQWHEIKGYMDQSSRTKLARFAKYFPDENKKLVLIEKAAYKALAQEYNHLPGWES